jgi:hypothetical protein
MPNFFVARVCGPTREADVPYAVRWYAAGELLVHDLQQRRRLAGPGRPEHDLGRHSTNIPIDDKRYLIIVE